MANIRPKDLPAKATDPASAIIIDDGTGVFKSTPAQVLAGAGGAQASALAADNGSALIGFLQSGTGALARNTQDKLRDTVHAFDFGVKADDTTDDTAAWRVAIRAAQQARKKLILPPGRTIVSDELFDYTYFNGLSDAPYVLWGDGMNSTIFVNKCVGKSPFNIGNSYFADFRNFTIEGNNLTGASGNGHAISMIDPDFNTGTFKPGTAFLERVRVIQHRGLDLDYHGDSMPACGVYAANALNIVSDGLFIQNNAIGAYLYQTFEPKFYNLVLDGNYLSGLIDDQNENLCISTGVLLSNDSAAPSGLATLHGGATMKAGSYVHNASRGSSVMNCKIKEHRYAGVSARGGSFPLIQGNWFLFNADGEYEVYCENGGVRLLTNTFDLSPPTGGARSVIKLVMGGGFNDFGEISTNVFHWYGGGAIDSLIDIDGSAASDLKGAIARNIFGDSTTPGNACPVTDCIRVSGSANAVEIRNNRAFAKTGVAITDFIDLSGCAKLPFIIENNIAVADGGTVTNQLNPLAGWAFDPPSIAAGAVSTTTVTYAGAALGDQVTPSFSLALGGLTLTAEVSAANTIKFTFSNPTGGAVDLAAGRLYARLTKQL